MKKSHHTLLILFFLVVLGFGLYTFYYKPVEGFFAKTDACATAKADKTFIQNQVTDISNSLAALQNKLNKVNSIKQEIQGIQSQNNCFTTNASSFLCEQLALQLEQLNTQISLGVSDQKEYTDFFNSKSAPNKDMDTILSELTCP